ncbi:MAG: hypothetical protein WAV10_03730 [Minisyncoccia bacterium]
MKNPKKKRRKVKSNLLSNVEKAMIEERHKFYDNLKELSWPKSWDEVKNVTNENTPNSDNTREASSNLFSNVEKAMIEVRNYFYDNLKPLSWPTSYKEIGNNTVTTS